MAPAAQVIRNKKDLKTEYSEKTAIGALYDELAKGIEVKTSSLKTLAFTCFYNCHKYFSEST